MTSFPQPCISQWYISSLCKRYPSRYKHILHICAWHTPSKQYWYMYIAKAWQITHLIYIHKVISHHVEHATLKYIYIYTVRKKEEKRQQEQGNNQSEGNSLAAAYASDHVLCLQGFSERIVKQNSITSCQNMQMNPTMGWEGIKEPSLINDKPRWNHPIHSLSFINKGMLLTSSLCGHSSATGQRLHTCTCTVYARTVVTSLIWQNGVWIWPAEAPEWDSMRHTALFPCHVALLQVSGCFWIVSDMFVDGCVCMEGRKAGCHTHTHTDA